MSAPDNDLENVHFGAVNKPLPAWEKYEELSESEDDPDDEELDETPADVVAMLGFDPAKVPRD